MDFGPVLLLGAALLLGIQHGIDWDHIAAITDISGTIAEPRKGFLLGTWYALGHALVVTTIGLLAILLGLQLPEWADGFVEPFVGATLVFLGVWIVYSLVRSGGEFQPRSRWMLLLDGLKRAWGWALGRLTGNQRTRPQPRSAYGRRMALGVGMIHGIGAETPSQVLLFLAVAGAGGKLLGTVVLLSFVVGLLVSNSAITVASVLGFARARRHKRVLAGVGVVAAVFSVAVGGLFLTGDVSLLPPILAGY